MEPPKNKGGRKKKPDELKKKLRSIYATDTEWIELNKMADKAGKETSTFIVEKALQP